METINNDNSIRTSVVALRDIAYQLAYSRQFNDDREHAAVVDALKMLCKFTDDGLWEEVVKMAKTIDVMTYEI